MSERKGIVDALPFAVRLALAVMLLACIAIAFYFDALVAFWAFLGPLLIVNLWTGQRVGKHTRTERPVVFWGMLGLLIFPTCVGILAVYERVAGPIQ